MKLKPLIKYSNFFLEKLTTQIKIYRRKNWKWVMINTASEYYLAVRKEISNKSFKKYFRGNGEFLRFVYKT
jgi:hypothetical protein